MSRAVILVNFSRSVALALMVKMLPDRVPSALKIWPDNRVFRSARVAAVGPRHQEPAIGQRHDVGYGLGGGAGRISHQELRTGGAAVGIDDAGPDNIEGRIVGASAGIGPGDHEAAIQQGRHGAEGLGIRGDCVDQEFGAEQGGSRHGEISLTG